MQYKLLDDIRQLTMVDKSVLNKFEDISRHIFLDCILETVLKEESTTTIDVGVGILKILTLDDEVKFQFIPSKQFEKDLIHVVTNKENPLEVSLSSKIDTQIYKSYKELL